MATVLCRLDDIAAPGSRGFRLGSGRAALALFVVRDASGRVFAYVNACPHTGAPLDWQPDRFLSRDRSLIQCATHGAQFRIDDGYCVRGPCAGAALTPLAVAVVDGHVVLESAAAPCRGSDLHR